VAYLEGHLFAPLEDGAQQVLVLVALGDKVTSRQVIQSQQVVRVFLGVAQQLGIQRPVIEKKNYYDFKMHD
jgi:hypothetical protein